MVSYYVAKKVAPKPAYERERPKQPEMPPAREEAIEVTEGEASDSMILRALTFWKR